MEPQATAPTAPEAAPTDAATVTDPAATPEAPEAGKDPNRVHERFVALGKKEAKLRAEKEAFESERTTLSEKAQKAEEFEQLLAGFKENPLALLDRAGLSFEDFAQAVLKASENAPPKEVVELKAELKEIKDQLQTQKELEKQAKQAEDQKYIDDMTTLYKKDVSTYLEEHADEFELVIERGGVDEVMSLVGRFFEETNEILDPREALEALERHYEEEVEALLTKSKKLQQKFAPAQQAAAPKQNQEITKQDVQEIRRPSPTIRSVTSSAPRIANEPSTDAERFQRAMAALQYK